jgi:Zn-dependent M16 (insulinase) family peptidase
MTTTNKTQLTKGQTLDSGFEILDVRALAEFAAGGVPAFGVWARHTKSGAEVFHLCNDDSENLFSFAFATPPRDSTGAAHILEHSVLCGSQNYPLKDAFLVLAQGSLQTFLNAWTFPDKTIYPASSLNEQDYFNLMAVYGDAVFRPLLSEWTFLQEGHRLAFEKNALAISGVVYNEMKGAYSSLDSYAALWSVKAVMPGTPYAFESGGDPDCIPDLSWDGLKDFHRAFYSPANCRVFLAGNISTEKQLAFLNEHFFSRVPAGNAAAAISRTPRWNAPQSLTVPCPAGAEQKPTAMLSWLCGDSCDTNESLSLAALAEILLGHDGSPLTRALIDSALGEDLSPVSGLEGELRETAFCAGLRGVDKRNAKKVEALIIDTLEKLAREGIAKTEIEAALLGMEFSQREITRAGGPFSLVWMRRALRAWLHGGAPWESLAFNPAIAALKKNIADDDRYFENLIRRYLLDNPHRAFVVIEPQKNFQKEKDAALAKKLKKIAADLSAGEKEAIVKKTAELTAQQEKEDSPEALAAIPHLARSDLKTEIETVERDFADLHGAPALVNPIFTNGISYVDIAFPVDVFAPEDYPWLPFFARTIVSLGLPGMDYGEVSSLMARTVGGFHAVLQTGSRAPNAATNSAIDLLGRDWIIFRLKALDEKIAASLELAHKLITQADFFDLRRIRDLALEMKNDIDSNLAPSGHTYAAGRSSRLFSRARVVEELWSGLDQLLFAHELVRYDAAQIAAKLKAIQAKLALAGAFVHITSGARELAQREAGKLFGAFGSPRPRNPASGAIENFAHLSQLPPSRENGAVFISPSMQVGFAAVSLRAAPYDSPEQAAALVLSHQLSTGALWETIRMKGGAYGAFCHNDSIEGIFSFATYRDPSPLRSLEAIPAILANLAEAAEQTAANEDSLTKAVIGAYAKETRPRTPAEKGFTDFLRCLYGIEDAHRARRLKNLTAVTNEQINAELKRLAREANSSAQTANTTRVALAGNAEAQLAAKKLGVKGWKLPI